MKIQLDSMSQTKSAKKSLSSCVFVKEIKVFCFQKSSKTNYRISRITKK